MFGLLQADDQAVEALMNGHVKEEAADMEEDVQPDVKPEGPISYQALCHHAQHLSPAGSYCQSKHLGLALTIMHVDNQAVDILFICPSVAIPLPACNHDITHIQL